MKKILILSLAFVALELASCESDIWPESEITKVPVYKVVDIDGDNAPYELQVYKTKPLLIQYQNEVTAAPFEMLNYLDQSNDLYSIQFSVKDSVSHIYVYEIEGVSLEETIRLEVDKDYSIYSVFNADNEVLDSVSITEYWPSYTRVDSIVVPAEEIEFKAAAVISSEEIYN